MTCSNTGNGPLTHVFTAVEPRHSKSQTFCFEAFYTHHQSGMNEKPENKLQEKYFNNM